MYVNGTLNATGATFYSPAYALIEVNSGGVISMSSTTLSGTSEPAYAKLKLHTGCSGTITGSTLVLPQSEMDYAAV